MKLKVTLPFVLALVFTAHAGATPIYCGVDTREEIDSEYQPPNWKPKKFVRIVPDEKRNWTTELSVYMNVSEKPDVEEKEASVTCNYFDMFAPGDKTPMNGIVMELNFEGAKGNRRKSLMIERAKIEGGTFKDEIKIETGGGLIEEGSEFLRTEYVVFKCWSEVEETE